MAGLVAVPEQASSALHARTPSAVAQDELVSVAQDGAQRGHHATYHQVVYSRELSVAVLVLQPRADNRMEHFAWGSGSAPREGSARR